MACSATAPMSSQDGEQSRFAHLLQPIRELAANWDIDVAKELEDYLVRGCVPQAAPHYRADARRVPGDAGASQLCL